MAAMNRANTSSTESDFQQILRQCISRELGDNIVSRNTADNDSDAAARTFIFPVMDHATFLSLNKSQFCKQLKEQSGIPHGRGVKILKALKQRLQPQTNEHTKRFTSVSPRNSLRNDFHWLHQEDSLTSELVNECWTELIDDDAIRPFANDTEFQSKMRVMLLTMMSDQRVSTAMHRLMHHMNQRMLELLYAKANKALDSKQPERALQFLDQYDSLSVSQGEVYKIWIKKSDCYLEMKDYKNALHFARECINVQPLSIKAYVNGGNALMGLSQFENSQEMFERATALAQNNPDAAHHIKRLQTEMSVSQLLSPQCSYVSVSRYMVHLCVYPVSLYLSVCRVFAPHVSVLVATQRLPPRRQTSWTLVGFPPLFKGQ